MGDDPPRQELSLQVGLVVLSRFVTAVADLLGAVVLVRVLEKEVYGALALLLVLHLTVGTLLQLGVPQSVLFFLPRATTPGQRKGFALQTVRVLATFGAVGAGLVLLLGLGFSDRFLSGRAELAPLVPLIALGLLLDYPGRAHQQTLIALDRHGTAAALNLALALGHLAALIVPSALGLPLAAVIGAWCAFSAVRLAVGLGVPLLVFRGVRAERLDGGVREQLGYSLPIGLAGVVGTINIQLDKLLVAGLFTAATFAEYSVAARELPLVGILPYTVASTILPRLAGLAAAPGGARHALDLWHASIRRVALVMLPVAAFLMGAASTIVVLLYTDDFAAATPVFFVYLCVLPLRVTSYGVMTQALGRPRDTLWGAMIGMVTNIALSLALVGPLGVLGPALGTVAAQAAAVAWFVVRIAQATGSGISGVFPWAAWLRTALVAALPALPLPWLFSAWSAAPAITLAVAAPVYVAAYLALARLAGLLGAEERAYVAAWLRLEPLRSRTGRKG